MIDFMNKRMTYLGCDGYHVCWRVNESCTASQVLRSISLSHKQAMQAMQEHRVLVDGSAPSWNAEFKSNAKVSLELTHRLPDTLPPDPLVVAHDPFFLVANKPAGLLVHGDGTTSATLTERLTVLLASHGSDVVPQAVQRLDLPTTGLVLFSLTKEFQPCFDMLVEKGDMRKTYLAVVWGAFPSSLQRIEAPIGRDRHDARRMCVSRTGKEATTVVHILGRRCGSTLLGVEILSGRRHQIRVHLANAGFPLMGDLLYGGKPCDGGLMLHAWREAFVHPVTNVPIDLEAPMPSRFCKLGFSDGDLQESSI